MKSIVSYIQLQKYIYNYNCRYDSAVTVLLLHIHILNRFVRQDDYYRTGLMNHASTVLLLMYRGQKRGEISG